ncbi:hypothetical protein ACS0TY_019069 [Phlomoides rotata]
MAIMALSSSSSLLPFSNFFPNPHSSRKYRICSGLSMAVRSSLSDDSTLLQAAKYTVDSFVRNGMVIGLGSGRASGFAIQYLGRQLRSGAIKDITGIPTSVDSASEAAKAGVPLDQYRDSSKIDLTFNDADVIEEESLAAVIGRQKMQGGESIIQEKVSQKFIFIRSTQNFIYGNTNTNHHHYVFVISFQEFVNYEEYCDHLSCVHVHFVHDF